MADNSEYRDKLMEDAEQITKDRFERIWVELDKNGDGYCDRAELKDNMKEDWIEQMFMECDTDKRGKITFEEFWADYKKFQTLTKQEKMVRQFRVEFNKIDSNKDGKITEEEMRSCLIKLDMESRTDRILMRVLHGVKVEGNDHPYDLEDFTKRLKDYFDENPNVDF